MSAKQIDGRTARRGDTREAVFEAALELFAEKSVSSTSVDDIAAAAGVAKGSIYYNFGSKSGLVDALLNYYLESMRDRLAQSIGEQEGWQAVSTMITELLIVVRDQERTAKLLAAEFFRTDRSWYETTRTWHRNISRLIEDALFKGQEKGTVAADINPAIAANCVLGAALMAGLAWRLHPNEHSLEEIAASIRAVVIVGRA
ncbi:AcrR family transcriptional regulator [Arcanobacterium pluranimalium]|uniref:TetR/AcrR family transcriptional regulator n=1 Tax=Arcanobacterium pluranimalium TaxID=108028 RepID=UPI00195B284D|nr:TetR/AcrR family transcriptional regulator [Arcanobacterium pluranimalium]MBM7825249.1 AcrR family transcriptional regulator [Arcanobacterium pluranimalium]